MVLPLTDYVTACVTETCNKQLEVLTELMVLLLTDNVTAYVTETCNKQTLTNSTKYQVLRQWSVTAVRDLDRVKGSSVD